MLSSDKIRASVAYLLRHCWHLASKPPIATVPLSCPECGSAVGIYNILSLPSLWSDEPERRMRRNSRAKAGQFGPCKYCVNGLIYDDSSGILKLRRVNTDEIVNSKIVRPGRLAMEPDHSDAHDAEDFEAVAQILGLEITEGTPEKNQQALLIHALGEASRLLSKDAVGGFLSALAISSFEERRDLFLALFSDSSDDDKRKLLVSVSHNENGQRWAFDP